MMPTMRPASSVSRNTTTSTEVKLSFMTGASPSRPGSASASLGGTERVLDSRQHQSRAADLDAAGAIDDVGLVGEILPAEERGRSGAAEVVVDRRVPDRGRREPAALAVGAGRDGVGEVGELLAHVSCLELEVQAAPCEPGGRGEQVLRRVGLSVAGHAA